MSDTKLKENKEKFWSEFNDYATKRDDNVLGFNFSDKGEGESGRYSSYKIGTKEPCKPVIFTIRINTENWEVNGKKNILACKIRFGHGSPKNKGIEIKFFEYLNKTAKDKVIAELSKYITDENLEEVEYDAEDKKPTIHLTRKVDNVLDIDKRDQYFEWLYTNGLLFKRMFYKYYMEFNKS